MNPLDGFVESGRSFMRLPLWVRLWLAFVLVPTNAASFLVRETPTGKRTSQAATFIGVANGSIILAERGFGKALAIPHLIVWLPLLVFVIRRLREPDLSRRERNYAVAILIVNGISLAFDAVDAWRWAGGEREVP